MCSSSTICHGPGGLRVMQIAANNVEAESAVVMRARPDVMIRAPSFLQASELPSMGQASVHHRSRAQRAGPLLHPIRPEEKPQDAAVPREIPCRGTNREYADRSSPGKLAVSTKTHVYEGRARPSSAKKKFGLDNMRHTVRTYLVETSFRDAGYQQHPRAT